MVGNWLGDANESVVQNHPGARTVVRREAMVEQGAMNVRDVLKGIPGVQVQDSNGTGGSDISLNVGVRGLTSRLSPRSTVLIDGIPAAFAPYGQPQLSMAPISAGNLDSIDVVRGAGSVRYGPQNVGGVINFVTRAIPETFQGEVGTTLETSERGGWKHMETAFLGGTADNGIGAALLYSGVKGDGYRARNNDNDIDDVLLKTHWAPTDQDDFSLNFHYYDATADMPGGLTRKQFDADPYQSVRDYDGFSGRRKDVSFKYLRQIDDQTQFEVLTYYTDSFRGSNIASRNLETLASYPRNYHTYGIEPRLSHVFTLGPVTQEVGVGYRYLKEAMHEQASQLQLVNNVPVVGPKGDGHVYQDRTGGTEANSFYIDDKIDVGNWTVTPGIRFERISTQWHDRPVLDAKGKPVQEKNRSIDSIEPRLSHVFTLGPVTQEVGVGYRYLKEAMHEQASQLQLVNNVPVVGPKGDGHVYQDRTGGTEANSFYIDDKIDVGNWTVTLGIRFERISTQWHDRPVLDAKGKPVQEKNRSIDSNEALPALSVMYHLSDAWKLFANYETSFGSLQYFQLGQGGTGDQTAAGLRPEKAKTYELGTRYDNGVWGGEVTLFYIDFADELQYISNDIGWTNLGATKHQGLETSIHYDLASLDPRLDGLTANAGFTYTKATSEGDILNFKGRDLPLYSRQVVNLGLRYAVNRWTYNVDMFAQSKQRAPGTGGVYITEPTADGQYGDIHGYATWTTRVGYDFGPEASNLKVGAGIKNLFNQEYFTRSSDNNSGLYLGEPRTFFVQASVGF